MQTCMSELEGITGPVNRAAIIRAHPRLQELVKKYGEVLRSAPQSSAGATIGGSVLSLRLTCVAAAAGAKMGTQVKKLPRTTQLGALRLLCDKLFNVRVGQQQLFVKSAADPVPQPLGSGSGEAGAADDTRTLAQLGLQVRYNAVGVNRLDSRVRAGERNSAAAAAYHGLHTPSRGTVAFGTPPRLCCYLSLQLLLHQNSAAQLL
jgi:hypothetical protein